MSKSHSRKDFIKKFGKSLGGLVTPMAALSEEEVELIDEQMEFLIDYEAWLKEFQSYVAKRNENPFDLENNKRLMELSAQREEHKTTLELYMKDPKFAEYFNKITKDISAAI